MQLFYCLTRILLLALDQTVTACRTLVNNGVDIVVVGVAEEVELVVKQVHLQDSLVHAHRLYVEALAAYYIEILLGQCGLLLCHLVECTLTQALLQTGLMLADLALDTADGTVYGSIHISRRFLGADNQTNLTHRDLDRLLAAQLTECNRGIRILLEVAIQLLYLTQCVLTQLVLDLDSPNRRKPPLMALSAAAVVWRKRYWVFAIFSIAQPMQLVQQFFRSSQFVQHISQYVLQFLVKVAYSSPSA